MNKEKIRLIDSYLTKEDAEKMKAMNQSGMEDYFRKKVEDDLSGCGGTTAERVIDSLVARIDWSVVERVLKGEQRLDGVSVTCCPDGSYKVFVSGERTELDERHELWKALHKIR